MADLKSLQDFTTARILLPIPGGHPLPLDCVARSENPPFIDVYFVEGQLPADQIDPEGECHLVYEAGGRPHGFRARIDKIVSGVRLRLEAIQAYTREQKREFFRVDTELFLRYRRLSEGDEGEARKVRGRVNLSGGGLWLPVKEELEPLEKLSLEILLPEDPPQKVFGLAEVVRMTGSSAARGVALKFYDIEAADRDAIVAFCFREQRRQLRTRVRVEGS